jgi:hypothetical protein
MPEPETRLLAPVLGAYLVLSALGFLRPTSAARAFAQNLAANPALVHALGAIAFLVGVGVVSFHRHWSTLPEIALSLTGCWWAFEGAGMLASPAASVAALNRPGADRLMRLLNVGALAVGGYLLAAWGAVELR